MAYPNLPINAPAEPLRIDGFVPVRAMNGTLKMRKMFDGEKMEFPIEHNASATDKTTLDAHYNANKYLSFTFTWVDGTTYTVQYMTAPLYLPQPGGWYKVRVRLGEV